MALPHVVIIGGGFGGLAAARRFHRKKVRVTLIDRTNHHLFQPLLYQVASAVLSPGDIAEPIRAVVKRQRNLTVMMGEVRGIDRDARQVRLADGREVGFDYLIVAAGARTSYFGHSEWERHAPGLKSLDDALAIRQKVLLAYERAEWCEDPDERQRLLTFVVIGGGPTGVEMAGALSEIARMTLIKDFRRINPSSVRVILVEGSKQILGFYPQSLSDSAARQLEGVGVELRFGQYVSAIDEAGATLADGSRIESRTIVWAAGVRASPLGAALEVPVDRMGRVVVNTDLTIPQDHAVFVIGDMAAYLHQTGQPLPGVAQVAIQMGDHVARTILGDQRGKPRKAFVYLDLGSMATVGRSRAVALIGSLQLTGVIAWLGWLFVHLMALVGFRNRLVVLFQWAWMYFTFQRSSRLIRDDIKTERGDS